MDVVGAGCDLRDSESGGRLTRPKLPVRPHCVEAVPLPQEVEEYIGLIHQQSCSHSRLLPVSMNRNFFCLGVACHANSVLTGDQ